MQPQLDATIPIRATKQIMTRAFDNQTNVLKSCESQRCTDMIDGCSVDSVSWIRSERAGHG